MQKDEQMFKGEQLAGDAIKRLREVCASYYYKSEYKHFVKKGKHQPQLGC